MESKPTKLGTVSFMLAIAMAMFWCIFLIVVGVNFKDNSTGETTVYLILITFVLSGILTILITLIGIVLGVLALRNQDPKRNLAIAGLVLNLCVLFLIVFIFLFF